MSPLGIGKCKTDCECDGTRLCKNIDNSIGTCSGPERVIPCHSEEYTSFIIIFCDH